MNKTIPLGIGITAIAIVVFSFSLSNLNLEENKETSSVDAPLKSDFIIEQKESIEIFSSKCLGVANCIDGIVTSVIDGDTLEVNGQSIRFALVDTPKLKYDGGQALNFLEEICPIGSSVVVDQDDSQLEDKYGRLLGVIYCNDLNLNKELLDSGLGNLYSAFCDQSEFKNSNWAKKHGC